MNSLLFIAAVLTVVVGIVHSVLGELLIFRLLRKGSIVPTQGHSILKERHVRILWATWHIVSIFGFAFAAILFYLSLFEMESSFYHFLLQVIATGMLISGGIVFWATQAKHPGWIGLTLIAICIWLV